MHIFVAIAFILIIASLGSALYFMMTDKGKTKRMVWSLAMRVGLSISRTIIEAHGGHLWAEPNRDGGTIFRLTLRIMSKQEVAAYS